MRAASLTDNTVFSSTADGHNWNNLIWNTQGADTDQPAPGRYSLYVSRDALSDTSPTFINGVNDSRTRVDPPLVARDQTFSIYNEGVGWTFDPQQHFVPNLFFDGLQSAPGISGVQNPGDSSLAAAGSPNRPDVFGNSGRPGAGTLSTTIGGHRVSLSAGNSTMRPSSGYEWTLMSKPVPLPAGSGGVKLLDHDRIAGRGAETVLGDRLVLG